MPYLEIYPIENYADKISKQLDAVLEAKPTMYAKTKGRYKQLACSLLQSVEKISAILEEESLISSDVQDEFDELLDTQYDEFSDALKSVQDQLSSYTEFTSNTSSSSDLSNNSNKLTSTSDNESHAVSSMSDDAGVATMSNKAALSIFAQVIEQGSICSFKCAEASHCARMIWQWFKARFTPEVRNSNFKYNIKQLPVWISAIVLSYGKHHRDNTIGTFVDMFNKWIADITADERNCWALPYEVYQISKSSNKDDFTLDAVVISDILMEELYHQLTQPYIENSPIYLESSLVPSIVKAQNPELLSDIRTRLSKQADLILKCGFTYIQKEA